MARITGADIHRMRALLVERWPSCFSPKGAQKRPLKVGIVQEVVAALPGARPALIATAIADYAAGPTYLGNMVAGAERIDLDGRQAGRVTGDDARHAVARRAESDKAFAQRGARMRARDQRRYQEAAE
jgi:sRNA-binding protein